MREKPSFKFFGIFGYPLSHTLSPGMQEAAFEKIHLKAFYAAFELEPKIFRKACKEMPRFILDGFNVTIPYKQVIMPYLDRVTPEAKAVGAVNTVFKKNGRWQGANTDVYGFLTSLKTEGQFQIKGKSAVIFGAGGAARAVLYGLASSGMKTLFIFNRHLNRAQKLAREFKSYFPKTNFQVLDSEKTLKNGLVAADLVVNATSLGLKSSDESVVKAALIPKANAKKKLFFDLIYHVPKTPFLKNAQKKGHRVLGGLGMLLFQGTKAFELWTSQKAPVAVMRQALQSGLKGFPK